MVRKTKRPPKRSSDVSSGANAPPSKHPRKEEAPPEDVPLSLLRSLCYVPAEVMSDVFLWLPFKSMEALGAVYGATHDAGWRMLLGDSLWYVWSEAMIRDLDADASTYVRDVVESYVKGRRVSLPRRCTSLLELYRIVVRETTYLRTVDSADCVSGTAVVVLAVAAEGSHELPRFSLPEELPRRVR